MLARKLILQFVNAFNCALQCYRWPVGAPIESHPAEDLLAGYVLPYGSVLATEVNRSVVYGRQFTNGLAVYNSGAQAVSAVVLPGGPYVDPATNATLRTLDLAAQTGRVLLRHW